MTDKHVKPRYEFRIFGLNFGNTETRLKELARFEQTRQMLSVYLLAAGNPDHNVKIREGVMDIKILQDTYKGLEQWNPFVVGPFPLKRDIIETMVFPSLGVTSPEMEQESFELDDFIDQLISHDPDLSVAWTHKTRHGYTMNECIVEIAEIVVNGAFVKTLCVESEDPEKVLETKHMLDIPKNAENVNYPLALKRIMGLVPLPETWKKRTVG